MKQQTIQEIAIKVYGRVQGVNFRKTIQNKANELALTGRVLNREDGSVEIVAQGERDTLLSLVSWIQQSPGFSSVKGITYFWNSPYEKYTQFTIVQNAPFIVDQAKSFMNLGKSFFNKSQKIIPRHVAIIPDGNRRWAKEKGLAPQIGHYTSTSFQHIQNIIVAAKKLEIEYLTLWGFSTENWKRNKLEVKAIFTLIEKSIKQFKEDAHTNKIRFRHLGRKDRLPPSLLRAFTQLEEETKHYTALNVQLCIDYGGRDELLRAVNTLIMQKKSHVTQQEFESYLDSYGLPDVDLIIRTSGEQRLSGFMPFQSVYAELYFSKVHFPDFTAHELKKAVEEFSVRHRRFGGDGKR